MKRPYVHRAAVPEPRRYLLEGVLAFVRAARAAPIVRRIALIGSLLTPKPVPKDADVVVTIADLDDLAPLARIGRRLKGHAQRGNLGADIFLADAAGRYLGRVCGYRECWPRRLCRALNCGLHPHLNDDLRVITLASELIAAPPIELWPRVVRRVAVPTDVEELLLAALEKAAHESAMG